MLSVSSIFNVSWVFEMMKGGDEIALLYFKVTNIVLVYKAHEVK